MGVLGCRVEGCEGTYYALDYCCKHYFKSRRTTTRELIPADAQCVWEGCERRPRARGHCASHYNILMGYSKGGGRQGKRGYKKQVIGYRAAHKRVEAIKGKATEHRCVDCGGTAREWSLDLKDNTLEEEGKEYSLNPLDYKARCAPCHRAYDGIE